MFGSLIQKQVASLDSDDKETPDSTTKLTALEKTPKKVTLEPIRKTSEKNVQWKRDSIIPRNPEGMNNEDTGVEKSSFSKVREPVKQMMNEEDEYSPKSRKIEGFEKVPLGYEDNDEFGESGNNTFNQLNDKLKKVESLMESGQNAEALRELQILEKDFSKSDPVS